MSLKARIQEDMKVAMKNQDKVLLNPIRMLWAALRKEEIDSRKDLTDEGVIDLVLKAIKQREETISFLAKDNRQGAIEKERLEIDFLKKYLPEPISEEDLKALILATKQELQALSRKDMGRMMAALMPKVKGKCDGTLLSKLVGEVLNG